VAHACNSSYLEGRDQEDPGSRPAQPRQKKPNMVTYACHPSCSRKGKIGRSMSMSQPMWEKSKILSQK
jgi:hypothetical protein